MSGANPSKDATGGRRVVAIIWLTIFIDLVGFSIVFPIFPAMLDWYLRRGGDGGVLAALVELLRSVTPLQNQDFLISVLFGGVLGFLYSLLQFVAAPLWGRLSDRHGRRRILLITTAGTAVAYAIWVFAGSFWLLIISRVLGGLMAGNIAVATAAIADTTTRSNRSKGMALVGVAFGLGFILGPAIGGMGSLVQLRESYDTGAFLALTPFSFPALLALALALVNWLWVWRVFPETYLTAGRVTPQKRPLLVLGSKLPAVSRALKVYFIFIFGFAGMEFTLTFLALDRLGYQPPEMVRLFLFVGIVMALTQGTFVRRFAGRIGERNLVTIGLLAGFLGLIQLSYSHATVPFYTGLALLGLGVGCASPCLSALVSLYAPKDQQGGELGAFRSVGSLGRALGPLFGAGTFWSLGSQMAYFAGACLLAIAALFSLLLPRPAADGEHS